MLNNLTNFWNIITTKMIKKVPEASDLISLGTRDSRYGGKYKSTAITVADFVNSIPVPPIGVQSVVAGTNVTVNNVDPLNPIVNSLPDGVQSIVAGTNVNVDNTDPANPIVNATGGSVGLIGTHILSKPRSLFYYSNTLTQGNLQVSAITQNVLLLSAFTPAYNLTIDTFIIQVTTLAVGGLAKVAIYSDLNGVPHTKLLESVDVSTDTTGSKTITGFSFTFTAGTTYWIAVTTNSGVAQFRVLNFNVLMMAPVVASSASVQVYTSWFINATYASLPTTLTTPTTGNLNHGPLAYLVFRSI
jgi:hypothetical protein